MIFVAKLNAAVPRSEDLHTPRNLGGEIELSGAEHPPIEVQKAPAARQKWLDAMVLEEIDLCAYGTPARTVGISALAIRLSWITPPPKNGITFWQCSVRPTNVIRVDEAAVSGFDLVHATISSAAEGMAVPELPPSNQKANSVP